MGLATIEIMARWLEKLSGDEIRKTNKAVAFTNISQPTALTADKTAISNL